MLRAETLKELAPLLLQRVPSSSGAWELSRLQPLWIVCEALQGVGACGCPVAPQQTLQPSWKTSLLVCLSCLVSCFLLFVLLHNSEMSPFCDVCLQEPLEVRAEEDGLPAQHTCCLRSPEAGNLRQREAL